MTWKCKNWDEWQTYRKDREQPPWIKLHRRLMRDHDWADMTDAQRGQLVSIWLLAADNNGEISDQPALIQKLCYLTEPVDLKFFEERGFLIFQGSDAPAASPRRRGDQPEKSRVEAEAETEYCADFCAFWDAYPRKTDKKRAYRAWKGAKQKPALAAVLNALESHKKSKQWVRDNGQYIPHPSTWINGERWNDEMPEVPKDDPAHTDKF